MKKKYLEKLFPNPYCSWPLLAGEAIVTSLLIVFYTTKLSFIRSLFNPLHTTVLLGSVVYLFLVFLLLGHVSSIMDRWLPWKKEMLLRGIIQFIVGILSLGVLVFGCAKFIFVHKLKMDELFDLYLERDFAVVMSCLAIVNFLHFSIYWYREAKKTERALSNSEEQVDHTRKVYQELTESYHTLQQSHQLALEQSAHGLQLYSELQQQIKILGQSKPIYPMEVFAFHLVGEKNNRRVQIKTWDGKDLVVEDIESLQALEALFPILFIKLTRDYLVNRYAIAKVSKVGVKHHKVSFVLDHHIPEQRITNETRKKMKETVDLSLRCQ